jgi:hypothetical protein
MCKTILAAHLITLIVYSEPANLLFTIPCTGSLDSIGKSELRSEISMNSNMAENREIYV